MRVFVGTSGFSYPAWRGHFYPEGLLAAHMLGYYAARLPAVEINNTFYRLPTAGQLARWALQVPADFLFALKASRRITHIARFLGAADLVEVLLRNAGELGARLGPVLFQAPPSLAADTDLLERFLDLLPLGLRAAFDLRHPSWLDDPQTVELLRAHGKALCFTDVEGRGDPLVPTASYGYLRLRRAEYPPGALAAWAQRLRGQPWSQVFAFFKHEEAGLGPAFAEQLARLMAEPELRPSP